MVLCFSQASGIIIIIISGNERPVCVNSSTTISIEAESDLPGKIIGKSLSICGPKTSLFMISSRTRILLTLPRRVFISPF